MGETPPKVTKMLMTNDHTVTVYDHTIPVRDEANKTTGLFSLVNNMFNLTIENLFRKKGIDVGNVGIIITRSEGNYGYATINAHWSLDKDAFREIGITPSAIAEGVYKMIGTMTHELIHCANIVAGVKDTSSNGYHNQKFKDMCDKVGLYAEKDERVGWRTPPTAQPEFEPILNGLYEHDVETLNQIKVLTQDAEGGIDIATLFGLLGMGAKDPAKRTQRKKNNPVHLCPNCGAKARAGASVNLVCGDCMVKMDVQQ